MADTASETIRSPLFADPRFRGLSASTVRVPKNCEAIFGRVAQQPENAGELAAVSEAVSAAGPLGQREKDQGIKSSCSAPSFTGIIRSSFLTPIINRAFAAT